MSPFILAFIASAALGAVIGLVRQQSEQGENPHGEFSGVRTFTLWSILGCVGAFLSEFFTPALLPVTLGAVALHQIATAYLRKEARNSGATTLAASLLTMCAGALLYWHFRQEAVLLGAFTAILIGIKRPLHDWTRSFTEADAAALLKFLAITGIILPLVPNQEFGPYDAFNPFKIWRMVVLISGVGFVGYFLMRLFSANSGMLVTSILGGLASSTATTLAFSRRSRDQPQLAVPCAIGVAIACTVMLPRLATFVTLTNPEVANAMLVPLGLMMIPGVVYAVWGQLREKRQRRDHPEIPVSNPLNLGPAIKFALIYAAITFIVHAASAHGLLERGLYPLAFISGLSDVDAIALSLSSGEHGTNAAPSLIASAIILAAVSNTLLKAGMAFVIGPKPFKLQVLLALLPTAAAGLLGIWLIRG